MSFWKFSNPSFFNYQKIFI